MPFRTLTLHNMPYGIKKTKASYYVSQYEIFGLF